MGLAAGLSLRDLGKILKRDHRTLGRELIRNCRYGKVYLPSLAQKRAQREAEHILVDGRGSCQHLEEIVALLEMVDREREVLPDKTRLARQLAEQGFIESCYRLTREGLELLNSSRVARGLEFKEAWL